MVAHFTSGLSDGRSSESTTCRSPCAQHK